MESVGLTGQDYHIQPVDQEATQRETATLNDITPNDYSKIGSTIDYTPTGIDPANTSVEVPVADIGGTGSNLTFSKDDENLEWKIWGEDRR